MITLYSILFLIILLTLLFIMLILNVFIPALKNKKDISPDTVISVEEMKYIQPKFNIQTKTNKKAFVYCSPNKKFNVARSNFNSAYTCFMINSDNGTGTDCKYSCIGLGDCVKVCPQQAIRIVNSTAVISSLCIGCGKCIDVCPLQIIKLVPENINSQEICANCTKYPTSCSKYDVKTKIEWNHKKSFKLWDFCYKIVKGLIKS